MNEMQTIAAIATPVGVGGVGIVRISGNESKDILERMFVSSQPLEPRVLRFGTVKARGFCDRCLAVYFCAPNSYTGEDVVEFHCHGGRAVVQGVLESVILQGARLAVNGEFTKRAFLNAKIDLAESEAVIDMINAESVAELSAQYDNLSGKLTSVIEGLQNTLTDIISGVEVVLDYPEEHIDVESFHGKLQDMYSELCKIKDSYSIGGLVKSGVPVAVVGKPNVGKSSLLNLLLGYDRAIVSNEAGTTRDVVSESIEINGVRFILSDTAGIRDSNSAIESLGINLSLDVIKRSDLVLFVIDGSDELTAQDMSILQHIKDKNAIIICNKKDKASYVKRSVVELENYSSVEISAKNADGLQTLKQAMFDKVIGSNLTEGGVLLTNSRHFGCIKRACEKLQELLGCVHESMSDIVALQLKEVWDILGEITGTCATEEIIDNIFSKFCLGK